MNSQFPSAITLFARRYRIAVQSLLLALIACIALPITTLFADVPSRLQTVPTPACSCPCHEATARHGCTKLCDAKRRATRWLATSCMKPRFRPPQDKSGAGPHFAHPPHAEHAQRMQ